MKNKKKEYKHNLFGTEKRQIEHDTKPKNGTNTISKQPILKENVSCAIVFECLLKPPMDKPKLTRNINMYIEILTNIKPYLELQ